jgi:hypothetical protein
VARSFGEPSNDDVAWLASVSTDGDADHARWELRYARRALLLHAARRDSLNDRTPHLVAIELGEALATDPRVDAPKREVSLRQFNDRVRLYGEAMDERGEIPLRDRLGSRLLAFAGAPGDAPELRERAGRTLLRYLNESNADLRGSFGAPSITDG